MGAKLIQPVLFSAKFGLKASALQKAGLIDPILNSDTKLFIDPLLIHKSNHPIIRKSGIQALKGRFSEILGLLEASGATSDAAWKAAYRLLDLDERAETGLGYGGASTSGSSRSAGIRNSILKTAKEIIQLGEKNPNIIPLMGLFEEGVGPDTLSDMTTNFLLAQLCQITQDFCQAEGVATSIFGPKYSNCSLPQNPFNPSKPIILVPRDIVRDLPLATDWADVSRVVAEIDEFRTAINAMFGDWAKATVVQRKRAVRDLALSSIKNMRALLRALIDASESYDEKADLDGHYTFRRVLTENQERYRGLVSAPDSKNQRTLLATVNSIITQFKTLVEDNNLWELLWNGPEARHERASQLLLFAVANVICATNNIDISPETNSGGGPVDFKFSTGYSGRALVEVKLSTGKVVSGYTKQLERYKRAAKTENGILVVVDVGKMGAKLRTIQRLQAQAIARGDGHSQIHVIDAKRQLSASKLS